jgi:uncharacterized protein YndB with AHSA1/START domain
MPSNKIKTWAAALVAPCLTGPVAAEIVSSSQTHYVLRFEAPSPLPPERLWQRLVTPSSWWHPDHTYSGDAGNLTLDARAGGLWQEQWASGAVAHGTVVYIEHAKTLRLEAPFGPLQALGAHAIWTISLSPHEDGTLVVFDEIATAPQGSNMVEMAKAVDFVKSEAMRRLIAPPPSKDAELTE